ncbi:amidohydrolase family protein [Ancylobacter sp. 6x-1]|uniref:Amidohydrolase family protein n=1 Tax=Ancylobacter crimeensis TaxID=2579147 RepID=A0ABT0D5U5_9HYPH|nr:amidohydrolase family protein [Ancylobacter crimeensis]MCK0195306.1 amidohydrolase family protein [Ancylobacter crimeensis]
MDIGIAHGRIVEIAGTIDKQAEEEIDAGGRAALPSFVEPHMHLEKAFLHRRLPSRSGTLEEAIRVTGALKARQTRDDVLERSRRVLDMAVLNGTTFIRAHPDVDPIQGLIGVETALALRDEYRDLIDIQIVAFPQEGILKAEGVEALMAEGLDMGADVVGGCPYNEATPEDTRSHIDRVFALAGQRDLPIDMHADFADDVSDPRYAAVRYIAEKTIATGYQGRVALGHVTSLGALEPDQLAPIIDLLQRADIHIVTLPATDVYLGGRGDTSNPRRGLAPVRSLYEAGVNVAYSSNNIRNAFTPFGKADPLQIGNLLAHLVQFGTPEHQAAIIRMGTHNAARVVGVAEDYGLEVGRWADIVILDTYSVADALLDLPARSWVLKRGRVVAMSSVEATICRDCGRQHAMRFRR